MTKATKGTVKKPSKNAKAKRGLNRVITQQGWGLFFELLEYNWLREVGNSSKLTLNILLKLVTSVVISPKRIENHKISLYVLLVGIAANADIKTAKNILVRGIHGNNASLKIAV